MKAAQIYESNYSPDEFLQRVFILMKKKVERILVLAEQESLSLEDLKEKNEKASQVLESIVLLSSLLDEKASVYAEAREMYDNLSLLLFKGCHENPSYLKTFLKLI